MDNDIYDEMVQERGKEYFLKNMVKYCIKRGDTLHGTVYGSDRYITKVDLKTNTGICTCPYQYNCKHAYALLESYKNGKYVDGDKLFFNFSKLDKEEILEIFEGIVEKHNLWDEFVKTEKTLLGTAKNMLELTKIEKKNLFTFTSFLRNQFLKNAENEELLEILPDVIKYIQERRKLEEILFLIVDELFERGKTDKDILKRLIELSRKYRELWMVKDNILDYEYFELLDY
ncbi:SWIM zinc finger domain-containing protein [Methanococcus maripaludis]|uniref:SWIM-type domain-containing protein n=2 Tax=Methanococcus maripaludis TaxID=39152 RepID=A0A7J9PGK7_METMI|nr:SWIM zinc finger family protein [Methanococcus maripaludis]MBA2862355.1 hypothetical protein [Methanococcus maripaludis]